MAKGEKTYIVFRLVEHISEAKVERLAQRLIPIIREFFPNSTYLRIDVPIRVKPAADRKARRKGKK